MFRRRNQATWANLASVLFVVTLLAGLTNAYADPSQPFPHNPFSEDPLVRLGLDRTSTRKDLVSHFAALYRHYGAVDGRGQTEADRRAISSIGEAFAQLKLRPDDVATSWLELSGVSTSPPESIRARYETLTAASDHDGAFALAIEAAKRIKAELKTSNLVGIRTNPGLLRYILLPTARELAQLDELHGSLDIWQTRVPLLVRELRARVLELEAKRPDGHRAAVVTQTLAQVLRAEILSSDPERAGAAALIWSNSEFTLPGVDEAVARGISDEHFPTSVTMHLGHRLPKMSEADRLEVLRALNEAMRTFEPKSILPVPDRFSTVFAAWRGSSWTLTEREDAAFVKIARDATAGVYLRLEAYVSLCERGKIAETDAGLRHFLESRPHDERTAGLVRLYRAHPDSVYWSSQLLAAWDQMIKALSAYTPSPLGEMTPRDHRLQGAAQSILSPLRKPRDPVVKLLRARVLEALPLIKQRRGFINFSFARLEEALVDPPSCPGALGEDQRPIRPVR